MDLEGSQLIQCFYFDFFQTSRSLRVCFYKLLHHHLYTESLWNSFCDKNLKSYTVIKVRYLQITCNVKPDTTTLFTVSPKAELCGGLLPDLGRSFHLLFFPWMGLVWMGYHLLQVSIHVCALFCIFSFKIVLLDFRVVGTTSHLMPSVNFNHNVQLRDTFLGLFILLLSKWARQNLTTGISALWKSQSVTQVYC